MVFVVAISIAESSTNQFLNSESAEADLVFVEAISIAESSSFDKTRFQPPSFSYMIILLKILSAREAQYLDRIPPLDWCGLSTKTLLVLTEF